MKALDGLRRRLAGPPAEIGERELIDRFQTLYYASADSTWRNTFWLGAPVQKAPTDLWQYQELIHEVRPDLIVETGTYLGGSAYYLACILDLLGAGEVVTIDVEEHPGRPEHPRITYVTASSVAPQAVDLVRRRAEDRRVMVVLDSDHTKAHVLQEMSLYGPMVSEGSYMVVEDTNINGHPIPADNGVFMWTDGDGPWEAVEEFVAANRDFVVDESRGKFMLSFNPRGYLRRVP